MEFKAGEDVIVEGDAVNTDRFYIVESVRAPGCVHAPPNAPTRLTACPMCPRCNQGELKGTKAGIDGEVCPRITSGGYFGELSLVKNQVRGARRNA